MALERPLHKNLVVLYCKVSVTYGRSIIQNTLDSFDNFFYKTHFIKFHYNSINLNAALEDLIGPLLNSSNSR